MSRLTRIATVAVVVLAVGGVSIALAQEGTATATNAPSRWIDHFVVKGGWITWFLLIPLSVAAMALALEHFVTIRRASILPPDVGHRIREDLQAGRYQEGLEFTAANRSVLAFVVHQALAEAAHGLEAMQQAAADAVEDRTSRLLRKIEYVNVIGSIAPMIGLFGTVYGMIQLFASIRAAGAIPEPAVIADNISIALVTTFWGLAVAIPSLAVFALLRNRIDVLMAECTATCDGMLTILRGETPPGEVPAAPPSPAAEKLAGA